MLANAVRSQKIRDAQHPPKTLAQQVFSSSPPDQSVKSVDDARNQAADHMRKALQPSTLSSVNSTRAMLVKPFKQPLKRSSSGFSDASNSSKTRRLSEQARPQSTSAMPQRQNSGLLDRLHSNSGFDDPDSFDEADLLALDPVSPTPPSVKDEVKYPDLDMRQYEQASFPKLPKLPNTPLVKTSSIVKQESSGRPQDWSSSPAAHFAPKYPRFPQKEAPELIKREEKPLKKSLIGRQLPSPDLKSTEATASHNDGFKQETNPTLGAAANAGDRNMPIEITTSPEVLLEKKRVLPWLQNATVEPSRHHSEEVESKRMKRPKKEKQVFAETPVSKEKNEDRQLWEQTPNGVKAEQKKLRQQQSTSATGKTKARSLEEDQPTSALRKSISSKKTVAPVFLSEEQMRVLNLVVEKKKSVFFTGSAGTGKSVLMREIIAKLREKYRKSPEAVAVTASTGLAACNIGGTTLHSFSGIGLGKESAEHLVKKVRRTQKALQRWTKTKVLVIDEISMIDGGLFDKLEQIARIIRKRPQAFGGIQLVVTGDFFQLPPVGATTFAFDASCWKTAIDHTIGLTHVFRQRDPTFAAMLNEMRVGKLTPASIQAFHKLNRPLKTGGPNDDGTEATELFPTRIEVENANALRMRKLGGEAWEFPAIDGGMMQDIKQRDKLLENCMAPQTLVLKKGAQVMLIKNIDETLVNGSIGKIVAFMDEQTFDYYDDHEEEFTSTAPEIDRDGQPRAGKLDLSKFANKSAGNVATRYPVVRFLVPDGTTRDLLCCRETWKIEQPNGEVLASRSQIPLILSWALSIHKAQGQTLEKVKVDLGRTFEKGQAYVALSRATTQEGLQVTRFDPRKVMAHDKVRRFYDTLYGVDTIGGMPKPTVSIGSELGADGIGISAEEEAELMELSMNY